MRHDEDDLAFVLFQDALEYRFGILDIVRIDRQVERICYCLRRFLRAPEGRGINRVDTADHVCIHELACQFRRALLAGWTQARVVRRRRRLFRVADENDRRRCL